MKKKENLIPVSKEWTETERLAVVQAIDVKIREHWRLASEARRNQFAGQAYRCDHCRMQGSGLSQLEDESRWFERMVVLVSCAPASILETRRNALYQFITTKEKV